jgi:hypothetical protein
MHGYAAARAAWNKIQANIKFEPWDPLPPGAVTADSLKPEGEATAVGAKFKESCRLRLWRWPAPGNIPICAVCLAYLALASLGVWRLWYRPSLNTMPVGVEVVELASALKDHNNPSITLGKYVMFTGMVSTDNSRFEIHPHVKVCKDRADDASCCVVVFTKPLPADGRLNKTVTLTGQVAEDEFGIFGGQWVIRSDQGLIRVNGTD